MNTNIYLLSFWGIIAIIVMLMMQWLIATKAKTARQGAVPGKMDPSLGHESFVFRAHRTFMNSLENIPAILGTCFLAILIGADPLWTAVFIWIFVVCRIIHMVLYYLIATDKNPSPRTYFFTMGLLANIALLGLCIAKLL